MQENRLRGRIQEGLYISDGFSSPKFFTLTTYLDSVKQPMQENRFRVGVREELYITDAFSYFKLLFLTSYLA